MCIRIENITEFCQENSLVIANTFFQQHKRRLYTWTSPHGQHQNQIDYILCSQRWRSSIQSTKTRPGADCGSDHELLIAKFRLKLKKTQECSEVSDWSLLDNLSEFDYGKLALSLRTLVSLPGKQERIVFISSSVLYK